MTRSALRIVQGLSIIIAGVAISGSAHAQSWMKLRNANMVHGKFYLGVSGGQVCNSLGCGVEPGTQIIMWQSAFGGDQLWAWPMTDSTLTNDLPIIGGVPPAACIWIDDEPSGFPVENDSTYIENCAFASQWQAVTAESLGAPYSGCFAIKALSGSPGAPEYLSVYQGNVVNSSHVVLWPLCQPNSLNCGNPSAWHPDQFWCPEKP